MKIEDKCFKDDAAIEQMIADLGGINNNDENGMTPLCFAALNGIKPDIIVKLINKYHANPNKKCNADDTTPLQNAIMSGIRESIEALLGIDVYVYDSEGNTVEDKTKKSAEQPKKDAAGNPLPERDENGDIIYNYHKGVLVPLNEGEKFISDKHQQRCKVNKKLVFAPPAAYDLPKELKFTNITYKFDKDGSHSQMRDADGAPIKQCYADGKEIHKKDDSGKELKNNYEYVWDYEGLPKYQVAYDPKMVHTTSYATIDNAAILTASLSPAGADTLPEDTPLGIIIHRFCNCTDAAHNKKDFSIIKDENNNVPIFLAVTADSWQSVELLIQHDSHITESVNYLNDTVTSTAALAISTGNEDILNKLHDYMQSISSESDLQRIEEYITDEDNIPTDSRPDFLGVVMPVLVNMLYGETVYDNATSHEYRTRKLGDDNVTIHLPGTNSVIDYVELALKYLPSSQVDPLYTTIVNGFLSGDPSAQTAKNIATEFPIVKNKCYTLINMLYDEGLFDVDAENNRDNKLAIYNAVQSKKLDKNELPEWPWWSICTLSFSNTYSNLNIHLPHNEVGFTGDSITLPGLTGTYEDSTTGIRWHAIKWDIGGTNYAFNSSYTLPDEDVVANVVCEKLKATLSFTCSEHTLTGLVLPTDKYEDSGTVVYLPSITGATDYEEPSTHIRWVPEKWYIGGDAYAFNSPFTLTENATADLKCNKKHVTLHFENSKPFAVDMPSDSHADSGDPISLPSVTDNHYTDSSHIIWHPLNWSIDSTAHNFNTSYTIFDDATATLEYAKVNVTLTLTNASYPVTIPISPSIMTAASGDVVYLPTITGTYSDDYTTYTPDHWVIDSVNYDFGVPFILYDNATAYIYCNEVPISVDITFENVPITLVEGSQRQVAFCLSAIPQSNVKLHFSSNQPRVSVSPSLRTFTPSNYNVNQYITLTAESDYIDNDNVTATVTISAESDDNRYNGLTRTLLVTVQDDDTAGISYDTSSITLEEGSTSAPRKFKLLSRPTSDVTLQFNASPTGRITFSNGSLTFTQLNWSDEQPITFTATDNSVVGDSTAVTVSISVSSSDTKYRNISTTPITINVIDNDNVGIDYSTSSATIVEGNSITRQFRLKSQPSANVTLNISSTLGSRLNISQSQLTFTNGNWNEYQSVVFTAIDTADGDVTAAVNISTSSSDTHYNNLTGSFNVTVKDTLIGKIAFTTGVFSVEFVNDSDTRIQSLKSGSTYTTSDATVQDVWASVYSEDYYVEQVPKSPHYDDVDPTKHFEYNPLYNDNE